MPKILVVDDDILCLNSLATILKQDSHAVTAISNGRDALKEIMRNTYDVCFIDVCLPMVSGIELLRKIQEVSPSTKVVMMTAGDLSCEEAREIEKYAYQFIAKPYDVLQIKMILKGCDSGVRS
jgi:DNA-binding NtrC family response regulator